MLFTFVGGRGHLDPLVPLATAARADGHAVLVSGQEGMLGAVRSLGFDAVASGTGTLFAERRPMLVPDREREQRVIRTSFASRVARERAADLVAIVETWRPDVVVCDEVDFGAMVAAERAGIPHVSVVVIAAGAFIDPEQVAEPLQLLRTEHGLPPDPTMAMLTRHLVLAPVPPSFRDPGHPLPATARSFRPAVLDETGPVKERSLGRPVVYVTLGTIFNLESDDLLQRVVEAIRDLPIDVIATVGPHLDPAELGPQPSNVTVHSFVAQDEVLRRSAAVVCHGGSGTVVGALAMGLPVVVLPLGADQLDNARRCVDLGVGIALDAMNLPAEDVRRAVRAALEDGGLRARAEAIAAEARALPPAADVFDSVVTMVRNGKSPADGPGSSLRVGVHGLEPWTPSV